MNEAFLYYIWQHQYFDRQNLLTTGAENILVVRQGNLNNHAGPDFFGATLKIGEIVWSGSVEIHTRSSDWNLHGHDDDDAYENVVLHVVWEDDKPIRRSDDTLMPTLILQGRVDEILVKDYSKLIHNPFTIPCTQSFNNVSLISKYSMIDRCVAQRLASKSEEMLWLLQQNNNDWEETTWQLVARNFGFKVNGDSFFQLGRSIPYRIARKHADKLLQVEALLFGQAGFLDITVGDEYYYLLQREYKLLSGKYGLGGKKLNRSQWRFLRLRPANFPTVRLAQFSGLVQQRQTLLSSILDAPNPKALVDLFSVHQSDYWKNHYRFNKKAKGVVPELGLPSVENILINTVVPLLAAWSKFNDDQRFMDRATELLQFLPAEDNVITREWKNLGFVTQNAFDSQGVIELYNGFCRRRICLNCVIGASLLKPESGSENNYSSI